MAFNTRNELLNLICMTSFSLVFLDPDGTFTSPDLADHNHLYMGFEFEESIVVGTFANYLRGLEEEEEEFL